MRLTVGQLAEAAGMTVRNVRNHQSRGLLPPPDIEARTGYYGERHLERLRLIQEMQADGYNLEAIRRLLSGSELRVATMAAEELARRFGSDGRAALAEVRASCDAMARTFVELVETERPGARGDAVESLRPVAARTVAALFDQAMAAESARALSGPARRG